MIEALRLDEFGRFRAARFPLKAVTLFQGKNEAGKTTLFDALVQALCAPRGNQGHGIVLKSRYGDKRVAAVEGGPGEPLDPEEFLNLLAIRSGDFSRDFSSGRDRSWLERVKARLFSGGIDPAFLAGRLQSLASTDRRKSHIRELNELEEARDQAQAELEELQARRAEILGREHPVQENAGLLMAQEAEAASLEEGLRRLASELEQERRIRERMAADRILALMDRVRSCREKLEQLKLFNPAAVQEMESLQARLEELDKSLTQGEAQAQEQEQVLNKLQGDVQKRERSLETLRGQASLAAELLSRLQTFRTQPAAQPRSALSRGFLIAALFTLATGVGVGFFFPWPTQIYVTGGGVVLALLLAFLAFLLPMLLRRPAPPPAVPAGAGPLERLKDEWMNRQTSAPPLASQTPQGLEQELNRCISNSTTQADFLEQRKGELDDMRESLEERRTGLGGLRRRREEAAQSLSSWLRDRGIAAPAHLHEKVQERRLLEQELERGQEELGQEAARLGAVDKEALRRDLERRLGELDREGVPREGRSEAELRALERRREEQARKLEEAKSRKSELLVEVEKSREGIRVSLENLPERIAAKERELRESGRRIASLRLDQRAAGLAARIMQELAGSAEESFAALSGEIHRLFRIIVPGKGAVEVKALDPLGMAADDAWGGRRAVALLSQGTRDAFFLAARLALARSSAPHAGLLVLDEPFLSLDSGRARNALKALKAFHEETGWQLILFSKDERMTGWVQESFPDALIHPLAAG